MLKFLLLFLPLLFLIFSLTTIMAIIITITMITVITIIITTVILLILIITTVIPIIVCFYYFTSMLHCMSRSARLGTQAGDLGACLVAASKHVNTKRLVATLIFVLLIIIMVYNSSNGNEIH